MENTGNELFNGNISNSTITLSGIDDGLPVGYSYGYDQLNRLLHTRWNRFYSGEVSWSNGRILAPYKEDIAYDANGNILKYFRNGTWKGHSLAMDSLTYYYNGKTNQLNYISDNIASTNYTTDIDNQSPNNYAYDSIGNLIQVASDGVTNMQWTVYGKLKKAIGLGFSQEYVFDANNNRVIKIGQQGSITGKQYYIRDAQGNILASYSYDGTSLKWNEQDLYGSSRVGLWSWNKTIPTRVMLPQSETDTLTNWYLLGSRYYELTNHLGNVLSVITDKKKGVSLDSTMVDHYQAEVLSQNDYYPFGMLEPGRSFRTIPYPYAFNGKRMENVELSITNIYDYGMRSYDARIGRFYSVDPLTGKYPWNSPYSFAENRPIEGMDLDGKELLFYSAVLKDGRITAIQLEGVQNTFPWKIETIFGPITINIPLKRFGKEYVLQFGFYNYAFGTVREMFNAIKGANEYFENNGDILDVHALPNVKYSETLEFREEFGKNLQRLGYSAAAGLNIGAGLAGLSGLVGDVEAITKSNLTKSQLKSISSLERQIAKHQQKLSEYIKDPLKFDNKGFLKNAPNEATRQKIIQSRIKHLQQEIKTFRNNIQKILNEK